MRCALLISPMTYIIDAHEDLAYNALTFGRDIRLSARQIREKELGDPETVNRAMQAVTGWPDYQRGQIGLIIASIFIPPREHATFYEAAFETTAQARGLFTRQFEFYERLCQDNPDMYSPVRTRGDLRQVTSVWEQPADGEKTRPVGLVLSMEGAEGVAAFADFEEYWARGLRLVGPVWAGTRYCGGTLVNEKFTDEGRQLLEVLAGLGYGLDIAHMTAASAEEALHRYEGPIIASHVNVQRLVKKENDRRHLSDALIRLLVERGGVMGILPYNRFIKPDWKNSDPREWVTLDMLAEHIDAVCQIAGSSRHVAIGTDFDGGFGYPAVPYELDTIADLQKLEGVLARRGYTGEDIAAIFHGNWLRMLERILPE